MKSFDERASEMDREFAAAKRAGQRAGALAAMLLFVPLLVGGIVALLTDWKTGLLVLLIGWSLALIGAGINALRH